MGSIFCAPMNLTPFDLERPDFIRGGGYWRMGPRGRSLGEPTNSFPLMHVRTCDAYLSWIWQENPYIWPTKFRGGWPRLQPTRRRPGGPNFWGTHLRTLTSFDSAYQIMCGNPSREQEAFSGSATPSQGGGSLRSKFKENPNMLSRHLACSYRIRHGN